MLQTFFTPKTIAVIGVSREPEKVGHVIFRNLYQHFTAFPVHVQEETILGRKAYKSVLDIPDQIDLAIIAIPALSVIRVVEECGKKRIHNVIIVSSGFKEIGNARLEYELAKVLDKYKMQCIGPNCLGIFDAHSGIDTLFLPPKKLTRPKAGVISFVTQSGAAGSAVLDLLASEQFGFAKFISYGNGTNVSETELLEFLEKDPQTKIICLYVEGIKDGKKFMEVAQRSKKPIIALKGGKTEHGAKAALSHTGALAGSYEIYKGAWKQSGVIIADALQEVFDIARLFEKLPHPSGKNVQVITNGGGYGILAIDALAAEGMSLAALSARSKEKLKQHLPKIVSVDNPLDLVGDATDARYDLALNVCVSDKNVDVILLIILHQTPLLTEKIVDVVRKYHGQKPIVIVSTGGKPTKVISERFEMSGFPVFTFPEMAVQALKKFLEYEH